MADVDLSGRVACITGAGRGIGRGVAAKLAGAGARIVMADVLAAELDEAAEAVRSAGGEAVSVVAEVGRTGEAQRVIDMCLRAYGRVDILVNNAAVVRPARALDVEEADWDAQANVILKGLFFFCQAAARAMIAAGGGGRIVNISSISAFHPFGCLAVYDAMKGGVVSLSRALAKEWGPEGITVNTVAPGTIVTPGSSEARQIVSALTGINTENAIRSVLGRVGTPEDISNAVLFLASGMGAFVTGQTIVVDGGNLLS